MRFVATLACLAASLAAQSVVFPSAMNGVANGSTYQYFFPFSNGVSREMVVYEDWDLNLPANTSITRIGFRQDDAQSAPSYLVQLEVRMGTTYATAETLSTDYDANFASSPFTAFPIGLVTLPALAAATPGTIVWVNLPNPYLYPGGNLLVDFRIYANNNGNQSFYYPLDETGFYSPVVTGALGCLHSGGQRPQLASYPTEVGGTWRLQLLNAPASTPLAVFVADQPMPAAPYSLSVLGLDPSCMGQMPLNFLAFSATSDIYGGYLWQVPVPNNVVFNHYLLTSQVLAFDYFSPGYLVTSNADQVEIGIAPPASILTSQGSATATTGYVYQNRGVVTFFN